MKSRTYSNAHIGEYKTYSVNNVYEAMYIAKYPTKIDKLDQLSSSRHAVNTIKKFEVYATKNSLHEALMKYKVQIVDFTKSKVALIPNHAYIKYSNDKWSPVIVSDMNMEGGMPGTANANLSVQMKSRPYTPRESVRTNILPPRPTAIDKTRKVTMSARNASARPLTAQTSVRRNAPTSTIASKKSAAMDLPVTPPLRRLTKKEALKSKEQEEVKNNLQFFEKIQYIRKRLLSKQLLQVFDDAFAQNNFGVLFANDTTLNNYIDEARGLEESYDRHGFKIHNDMLPCYELIHTLKSLNRVYRELPKIQLGSGPGEYSSDEDDFSERGDDVSTIDENEIPTLSLINGTVFESDDDDDDDYKLSPEDTAQFFIDEMDTIQFQGDNAVEMGIELRKLGKWKRILRYVAYFTAFIFMLVTFYVYQASIPSNYLSMYFRNQSTANEASTFKIEEVTHEFQPVSQSLPLDMTMERSTLQKTYIPEQTSKLLDINLLLPDGNMDSFKDYVNKYSDYVKPTDPPACRLISSPDNLSFRQQLFAHKENLVEYYIEMLEFLNFNDKTNDVLRIFPEIDKEAHIAFIKGENTRKNYIQLVNDGILPNVIKRFNDFGGELSDVSSVRQFFKTLKAIDSYSTTSTRFKERMNTFEDILVEQAVRFNKGISFQELTKCQRGSQNVMDITLSHYTQGLLFDLRMNYKDIAKRNLQLYENFIPVIDRIFELYSALMTSKSTTRIKENEFERVLKQFRDNEELVNKIPELQRIYEILNDKQKDQFFRLNSAIDIIAQMNPRFNQEIKDMKDNLEYNTFIQSITGGIVDVSKDTTQRLFRGFQTFATDSTTDVVTRVAPNFAFTISDVSNMMVRALKSNILTDGDSLTINYIAGSRVASVVYDIFSSSEIFELFQELPGFKIAGSIAELVIDQTLKDASEDVVRMTTGAMNLLNTEIEIRQTKLNSKSSLITNTDIFKMIGTYFTASKDASFTKKLLEVANVVSKDYIRLNIEIQQRELALVLFHLQNDILSGGESNPSYSKNLVLANDQKFLNSYYKDKKNYVNKIAQKLLNIMGLTYIENNKVYSMKELSSSTGGGQTRKNIKKKELEASIIEHAKKHNNVKMKSIKDIDMKLKKKLLKSYLKHNPQMAKKIIQYRLNA